MRRSLKNKFLKIKIFKLNTKIFAFNNIKKNYFFDKIHKKTKINIISKVVPRVKNINNNYYQKINQQLEEVNK